MGFGLFELGAFVVLFFSNAEGDEDFYFVVFPIHLEGKNGAAFDGSFGEEALDLGAMEEELADGGGGVVLGVGFFVGFDFGLVEEGLAVFDANKGASNLDVACADGFDFGAFEDDAGFEGFEDGVVAVGFGVGSDVVLLRVHGVGGGWCRGY